MHLTLAEHMAEFTPKTKFREKKFLKFLRKTRKAAHRSRTKTNQPHSGLGQNA